MENEDRIKLLEGRVKDLLYAICFLLLMNLLIFGGLLNVLILSMNGGRMPILTNQIINTPTHFSTTNSDNPYGLLIDRIGIPWGDHLMMISIGDLFIIFSSVSFFILATILAYKKVSSSLFKLSPNKIANPYCCNKI